MTTARAARYFLHPTGKRFLSTNTPPLKFDVLKERNRWESLLTTKSSNENVVSYLTQTQFDRHLETLKKKGRSLEYNWLKASPSKGVIRVPQFSPSSKPLHLLRFRHDFDNESLRSLTSNMADLVSYMNDTSIPSEEALSFEPFLGELQLSDKDLEECLLAYCLDSYSFDFYKTTKTSPSPPALFFPSSRHRHETLSLVRATYLVQDLISTPACDLTPARLQRIAEALTSTDERLSVETIVGTDLLDYHGSMQTTRGCQMIYNVGRAAKEEDRQPRLICIRYKPSSSSRSLCLVGKGVTYDTGGLNLKPGSSMLHMKKDMGGAAHVLGLLMALVEQDFPQELTVWIPAVENVVDGDSYRPGDVLTSVNGKTTEIGNTDAEGRLILADALALASAEQESADLIIDFATLTGAARVAMGTEVVPFFSNMREYSDGLSEAAREVHDPIWNLPLWKGYRERITAGSKIADLRNIPSDNGLGGAITAALYLQEFVGNKQDGKQIPWIHLDVYGIKGSSGIGKAQGFRSLFRFLSDTFSNSE